MPDDSFGAAIKDRLRALIVSRGYSVSGLSVSMGHSTDWLAKKLDGRMHLRAADVDEVCAFLGVAGASVATP